MHISHSYRVSSAQAHPLTKYLSISSGLSSGTGEEIQSLLHSIGVSIDYQCLATPESSLNVRIERCQQGQPATSASTKESTSLPHPPKTYLEAICSSHHYHTMPLDSFHLLAPGKPYRARPMVEPSALAAAWASTASVVPM